MSQRPTVVLLAAGESSRFWPLSTHGHKSLHRLCGYAIIEHTVKSLASAGFTDIIVVQSPIARAAHFPHRTVADHLDDGSRYGVALRYVDQPEANGPGDALLKASDLLGNQEFFVVQPENVNAGEILAELQNIPGNAIAVKEETETWLFGVCAVEADRVVGIVEKPEAGTEPSRLCNMGVGKFNAEYLKELRDLPPDPISSVQTLEKLAERGELRFLATSHPFFPLKYPWHLFAIADHLKPVGKPYLGENATVDPAAGISDDCVIEQDAEIGPGARLSRALIGAGSRVRSAVNDSILAADVNLEPDITIETKPVDQGHVTVDIKGHEIDTTLPALGAVIGQGTIIRRGSVISAGAMVGAECEVGAGTSISQNLPDRTGAVEPGTRK